MLVKFLSWNVNGLRAIIKKGQWDWLNCSDAQIIGLQEIKANVDQLPPEVATPPGWHAYWNSSVVKKGYSGVSVFSRIEPLHVTAELPSPAYQGEGRLLHLEFPQFHYFNGYFPNGGADILDEKGKPTGEFKRVPYKMGFLEEFLQLATDCQKTKPVVVCGDFNIAHRPIDLTHPKENEKVTGFLPMERDWIDRLLAAGFVDTFRHVNGDVPEKYTWWSYKNFGRARNSGWRLDYFFVSGDLAPKIADAWIASDITGSDHCPVGLALNI